MRKPNKFPRWQRMVLEMQRLKAQQRKTVGKLEKKHEQERR